MDINGVWCLKSDVHPQVTLRPEKDWKSAMAFARTFLLLETNLVLASLMYPNSSRYCQAQSASVTRSPAPPVKGRQLAAVAASSSKQETLLLISLTSDWSGLVHHQVGRVKVILRILSHSDFVQAWRRLLSVGMKISHEPSNCQLINMIPSYSVQDKRFETIDKNKKEINDNLFNDHQLKI